MTDPAPKRFFRVGAYASTRPELNARSAAHDLREGEVLFLGDEDRLVAATSDHESVDAIMRHDTGESGHKLPWLDGENAWDEQQTSAGGWLAGGQGCIGYAPDARDTADQGGVFGNVALDAMCGTIALHAHNMAANEVRCFDVLNYFVEENDLVVLNLMPGNTNPANYTATALDPRNGRFTVQVRCNTASGITDDLAVRFAIIRA